MVCIEKRPHILYGRSSAPHFRYLTCLLDRGHIKQPIKEVLQDKADEKKAQRTVPAQTKHKQQDMEL